MVNGGWNRSTHMISTILVPWGKEEVGPSSRLPAESVETTWDDEHGVGGVILHYHKLHSRRPGQGRGCTWVSLPSKLPKTAGHDDNTEIIGGLLLKARLVSLYSANLSAKRRNIIMYKTKVGVPWGKLHVIFSPLHDCTDNPCRYPSSHTFIFFVNQGTPMNACSNFYAVHRWSCRSAISNKGQRSPRHWVPPNHSLPKSLKLPPQDWVVR